MRRLIANIGLALSALVLVGTTYTSVASSIDSNIEFKNGEQLVFRATPKSSVYGEYENGSEIDGETLKSVADEFENRLQNSNVSRYKVVTEGADTIKVILARDNQDEYEKIKTYLSFNGSFALATSSDVIALGSEFINGKCYLDDINGYPAVVIPFDNESASYKAVYEEAKRQNENGEGETTQNDEGEDVVTTYMYFWYDYLEGYDTYSKTVSSNSDYDQAVASKILMKFNYSDPYFPKAKEDDPDKLYNVINIDADGDGAASPSEVKAAYNTGRYFVNLLNASELDAHIECIYSTSADLWIDEVLNMGAHLTVAFSNTFKAVLVSVLILGLLLALFYRFGALNVGTISVCASYLGMCMLTWLGIEFSVAAMIGIIAVAIASIGSGIVYLNKLKEECYRGRSIKKANSEAFRRALLPIVDIHVVLIIIGAFAYILGGALMKAFAAVAVLGGACSLLLNTLGLGGLMWLATNGGFMKEKYEWFGVNKENVPNLMNEEKQKFFGEYADKDFTKKKKPFGIVAAVLFLAAIGGMITTGCIRDGVVYKPANYAVNTEIFMEMETTADNNDILESETREKFLEIEKEIKFGEETLATYVSERNLYNRKDVVSAKDGAQTIYYSYYVVSLNKTLTGEEEVTYGGTTYKLNVLLANDNLDTLGLNNDIVLTIKNSTVVSKDQPAYAPVMLASAVGMAVACVYLLLRYRLSRGIATLIVTTGIGGITAGLFALIPLSVGGYVLLAAPIACLIAMIMEIMLMNKERELVIEDKTHDKSVENRETIMVNATKYSCTPIITFGAIVAFIAVILLGFGPVATSFVYMNILFGILVGGVMTVVLLGPVAQIFYKLFSKVNIDRPTKKSKKAKAVHKSAEPEEAVFIGIND